MKLPPELLKPLRNPFSEAKRKELAVAMTKKMVNDALKEGKNLAKHRDETLGKKDDKPA